MKKLILSLFSLLFLFTLNAQDAGKLYKEAKKSYNSANMATDAESKEAKLNEAVTSINDAIKMIDQLDGKDKYKAYLLAGEIYRDIATEKVQMSYLGKTPDISKGNDAMKAYEGFMNAFKLAEKKYQKKETIQGLQIVADHLSNYARMYFGDKNYGEAYNSFNTVLVAKKELDANGEKVLLTVDTSYQDHLFLTGLSAMLAEKNKEAKNIFQTLYELGTDESTVYESLFKLTVEEDKEAAIKYLDEGRTKFPEDEGLRIAEINYYLQEGKLEQLTSKLEAAIDQDPKNISLYTTLGYVHDNLFQREKEAGNEEAATKHYTDAMTQYNRALEMEPKNASALYSVGALIYNKAAVMTQELATLEDDYSPSGIKKYEAKKAEIFKIFDEALPYFQKAEAINPNDVSTLIALKEIYAKKNEIDKYNEFKDRLEKVQAGEKLDKSYFD